ncbi:pyridoxamine 5'-phosphate oxidase family protein [Polaromonas sp.]|nr:pyridoxamine 5'-phosphate oxidase family protein [Candidatus Saccharibacteria bacterium]
MHKNNTDHKLIHAFLKKHPMGVLSTVGVDNVPWGAAVYYLSDEDFNIYFVTRAESLKYKNIEMNPYAALTVSDSETQITVQLSGKVSTMPVQKYMDVFFDKFANIRPDGDYEWAPPIDKVHEGNYMPLQLTPTKMQYADYGSRRIEVQGNYIEQIIPNPK